MLCFPCLDAKALNADQHVEMALEPYSVWPRVLNSLKRERCFRRGFQKESRAPGFLEKKIESFFLVSNDK